MLVEFGFDKKFVRGVDIIFREQSKEASRATRYSSLKIPLENELFDNLINKNNRHDIVAIKEKMILKNRPSGAFFSLTASEPIVQTKIGIKYV